MRSYNLIIALILSIILFNCTSVVYSPSMNLPDTIKKDETTIIAAYEILPSLANKADHGIIVAGQHSFTNELTIQLKYWSDLETYDIYNGYLHGASLTTYYLLNDEKSNYRVYLIPSLGMSLEGNQIKLGVFGSWIGMQTPSLFFIRPYLGLGVFYGTTNFESQNYWGIALASNIGINMPINKELFLHAEMAFPLKYERFGNNLVLFYTPTIGLSYKFH